MKSTLAILALAFFAAVSGTAFAGDFCHSNNYSYNSGYSSHHGGTTATIADTVATKRPATKPNVLPFTSPCIASLTK